MSDALRPAAYVAGLAALFCGALGAGSVLGDGGDDDAKATPAAQRAEGGHGDGDEMAAMGGKDAEDGHADGAGHGAQGRASDTPAHGLAVAENGLRLEAPSRLRAGVRERFAFRVVDGHGETVRDFDVEHTKRLHLIAVRRDLTGFQHLHPRQDASGTWSTDLELKDPGAYRVFADFTPAGGKATTLASDVLVGGDFAPRALPAPASSVKVDGFDVRLQAGRAAAGRETTLTYTVSRNGKPVAVEPYLGAAGHLVALRAGDLAYLHVHPLEGGEQDGRIRFMATYPSAGNYRLFLQFKVGGRIHTAALTQSAVPA
jgi:hypothetical protein